MEMPNTIFAVLIGLVSLVALGMAARVWGRGESGRRAGMGWLVFAASGAIQVVNLLSGYNVWLAILTTLGMLAGIWMGRAMLRQV